MASTLITPDLLEDTSTSGIDLRMYHRIVILTEAHTTIPKAKTATALLKYRTEDILAVLDSTNEGAKIGQLLSVGGDIPVVSSLESVESPDALFIGIGLSGGKLPESMRTAIHSALQMGIDVVSGLHDFLSDDSEFTRIANKSGSNLIDVRNNSLKHTAQHVDFRPENVRVHTVGHDCSVGKMIASVEIQKNLKSRGIDSKFLATGQTGIMVSGEGIPIDCVVSDFLNGAAEKLVEDNQEHDYLIIEGQGSIVHPSYSGVTMGLLHGCAPHGLILCYEAEREQTKNLGHVPLQSLEKLIGIYETLASVRNPCKVIGIAINGNRISPEQGEIEKQKISDAFGLPVCDVFRDGATVLADAVLELGTKVRS